MIGFKRYRKLDSLSERQPAEPRPISRGARIVGARDREGRRWWRLTVHPRLGSKGVHFGPLYSKLRVARKALARWKRGHKLPRTPRSMER